MCTFVSIRGACVAYAIKTKVERESESFFDGNFAETTRRPSRLERAYEIENRGKKSAAGASSAQRSESEELEFGKNRFCGKNNRNRGTASDSGFLFFAGKTISAGATAP